MTIKNGMITVSDVGHGNAAMELDPERVVPIACIADKLNLNRPSELRCCSVSPYDSTVVLGESSVHETCPTTFPLTSNPQLTYNVSTRVEATVGPVIGAVTSTTARILLEVNSNATVTVIAVGTPPSAARSVRPPRSHTVRTTELFDHGIPKAVTLTGLRPHTFYTLTLSVPTPYLITSSFTTLQCDPVLEEHTLETCPLRCAVVSGHIGFQRSSTVYPERSGAAGSETHTDGDQNRHKAQRLGRALWKDLYQRVYRKEIDLLFHLGNLPYLGATAVGNGAELFPEILDAATDRVVDAFPRALVVLRFAASPRHAYVEICEIFRWVYRTIWNGPFIKQVLANVPNYMMMLQVTQKCKLLMLFSPCCCCLYLLTAQRVLGTVDASATTLSSRNESELGRWHFPKQQTEEDTFVVCCAYEVYLEYTRNLVEDYAPKDYIHCSFPISTHLCYTIGADVAFLSIDLKVCKSSQKVDDDQASKRLTSAQESSLVNTATTSRNLPLLGFIQWADLLDDLKPDGRLDNRRYLIICTQQRLSDPASMWFQPTYRFEAFRFLHAVFRWKCRRPSGHRGVLFVATETAASCASSSQPDSGVADIVFQPLSTRQETPAFRIREFSSTGMGNIACLASIPPLSPRHPLTTLPSTKQPKDNFMLDKPTYYTAEGDVNQTKPRDLRDFPVSAGLHVTDLGQGFTSLRYPQANINGYGVITLTTRYTLPENQEPNARNPLWAQYTACPSALTQLIGAEFSTQQTPPLPSLIYFPPVAETQIRVPQCPMFTAS